MLEFAPPALKAYAASQESVSLLAPSHFCCAVRWCNDARYILTPTSGPRWISGSSSTRGSCVGPNARKPTLESLCAHEGFHMQIPLVGQSEHSFVPRELCKSEGARYCTEHGQKIDSVELKEVVGGRAAVRLHCMVPG